ncbi:hypothetical protein KHQ84_gp108 [Rhodococcus phage Finch]|uniref:Uncharacterized protein n=1 Tax=Rhodococcus phage Finch TaxID=2094144 RepID=A0A2P1JXK7_9CAUD|nr:hypothetical protein KHQ84_gp108 [Rhodococcus phage Finch]AVO25040.1 hypothetical protein SEA_FINCH_108 [Rhodococcus phage Finch]
MSFEQIKIEMKGRKTLARMAFMAGYKVGATEQHALPSSASMDFGIWWNRVMARLEEMFPEREIKFLGRMVGETVTELTMDLAMSDEELAPSDPTVSAEALKSFVAWARKNGMPLDENKVARLGLE